MSEPKRLEDLARDIRVSDEPSEHSSRKQDMKNATWASTLRRYANSLILGTTIAVMGILGFTALLYVRRDMDREVPSTDQHYENPATDSASSAQNMPPQTENSLESRVQTMPSEQVHTVPYQPPVQQPSIPEQQPTILSQLAQLDLRMTQQVFDEPAVPQTPNSNIQIASSPPNRAPTLLVNITPNPATTRDTLTAYLQGNDPENTALMYEWRRGGNSNWRTAHTHTGLGSYTAGDQTFEFRAADTNGLSSSIVSTIVQVTLPPEITIGNRFLMHNDATFTDLETGLMWEHVPSSGQTSYRRCVSYCENSRQGGYTDWRMPWTGELRALRQALSTLTEDERESVVFNNDLNLWSNGALTRFGSDGAVLAPNGREPSRPLYHINSLEYRHALQNMYREAQVLPVRDP